MGPAAAMVAVVIVVVTIMRNYSLLQVFLHVCNLTFELGIMASPVKLNGSK